MHEVCSILPTEFCDDSLQLSLISTLVNQVPPTRRGSCQTPPKSHCVVKFLNRVSFIWRIVTLRTSWVSRPCMNKYVRVIVEWCVTRGCCLQVSTNRCFSAICCVTSAKASITHKISTHSSTIWKDTCKTRKGSQSSNQTFLVRFLLFLFCCSFRWCLCATAYTTDRWLYAHPLRSSHTTRSLWLIYFVS